MNKILFLSPLLYLEGSWSVWSSWSYCYCSTGKRKRQCVSKTVSNPDCGPGLTEETKQISSVNLPRTIATRYK